MFSRFAAQAARLAAHPRAFAVACLLVLVWAATGPLFQFSDTWQLIANTGTTLVTFLLGFLMQHALSLQAEADEARKVQDSHTLQLIRRLVEREEAELSELIGHD